MGPLPARRRLWTRRALLAAGTGSSFATSAFPADMGGKGRLFPAGWQRFPDPVTEFEVYRLTDPAYTAHLPAFYNRAISRRNNFLLCSSDRTGSPQAFRLDLKTGECRQLTDAEALDGSSLTLMPDEHSFCCFDGASLRQINLANLREREIYQVPSGWQRTAGAYVSEDGQHAVFAESRGGSARLQLVRIPGKTSASTVVETASAITHPTTRPKRTQILYRQPDQSLWLVNFDGKQQRRLKLAGGVVGPARWSPDGKTVLYLNFPEDPTQLNTVREHTPDENLDKVIAKTSQFVHFGCNADTSVFVGSSRNKAAPYILILLRVTRRELTLCEHRASDPALAAPVFSPDSRRVFFVSDKQGKPAIYRVMVEKFVEPTESESQG